MRTCVIIPTYNESKAIAELIKQIKDLNLEVIIIDDGSNDQTVKIAQASGSKVLLNETNIGKGAALIKGYNFAIAQGFDAIISMDGDGQHSSGDIKTFIQKAQNPGVCVIIGNRMMMTKKMPLLRIITNNFMSWLLSLIIKQKIPDTQCGFRLVKKEALLAMNLSTTKYETESEILIKAGRLGYKIESVPVKTIYCGQKSKINPFIDTLRFLRLLTRQAIRNPKHA